VSDIERGKFNRFNVIDGVLIVLIIAMIAGAAWFFMRGGGGDLVYVYSTVEFQNMEIGFSDLVSIGDEIRCAIRNYHMGHVARVETKPSYMINFSIETEEFVRVYTEGYYDVYITIRGRGTANEGAIYSEGQIMRVGREISMGGRGYAHTGFITELRTAQRGSN